MTAARKARPRRRPGGASPSFPQWDFDFDAPTSTLLFGFERAMFALGDGTVRFVEAGKKHHVTVEAHAGAVLCGVLDGHGTGVVTGGDDGRLVHTGEDGRTKLVASTGGRWMEQVAVEPSGSIAWAHGRTVELAHASDGAAYSTKLPSSCGGLAFEPGGGRLAAVHFGGATLLNAADGHLEQEILAWKGSHIAVSWSPDARFLVTAMQEAALHIWRLSDGRDLHMSGYPAKPRGLSWCANEPLLATTGGPGALTWSFSGPDGPEGRRAKLIGERDELVTAVAWHPVSPVLGVGFRDGLVLVAEAGKSDPAILRVPDGDAVAGLAWRPDGRVLAWGTEAGKATLIDLSRASK